MTILVFLVGSAAAAVIGWGTWALIITYLDPIRAGVLGFLLFYLALYLAVAASASLIGYLLRRLLQPQRLASYAVRPAARQGLILAGFLDLLLLLQQLRLYRWWVGAIVAGIVVMIELVFISYDFARRRPLTD